MEGHGAVQRPCGVKMGGVFVRSLMACDSLLSGMMESDTQTQDDPITPIPSSSQWQPHPTSESGPQPTWEMPAADMRAWL